MNKQRLKLILMAVAVIVVGIVFDQVTKWLCVKYIPLKTSVTVIPSILDFTHIQNTGAAWGMFGEPGQRWIFLVISSVAIVAMLGFLFTLKEKSETLLAISLAMIASGGIGNMIDRLALGYVVDFVDTNPFLAHFHLHFPIYNGADILVCVGAALMVLAYLILWHKEAKEKKESQKQ